MTRTRTEPGHDAHRATNTPAPVSPEPPAPAADRSEPLRAAPVVRMTPDQAALMGLIPNA